MVWAHCSNPPGVRMITMRPGSLEILRQLFISMDVHKATISIRIAEDGRNGPVRFLGVIPNPTEV